MSHFGRQPEHVAALSPLRWNLVKLEQNWSSTTTALKADEQAHKASLLAKHNEQRRQMEQQLSKLRIQTLAKSPLKVRLRKMRSTADSLQRRGRPAAAEAVLKRLKPLEDGYIGTQLREAGYTGEALRLQESQEQKSRHRCSNDALNCKLSALRSPRVSQALTAAQSSEEVALQAAAAQTAAQAQRAHTAHMLSQKRHNKQSSDDPW
eukprot:3823-Heterococcus_DN1.PRE.2